MHYLFISQNRPLATRDKQTYIEWEIDATSGTFIMPFAQVCVTGQSYRFNIYVNDALVGIASGTVDRTKGTGYTLTGLKGERTRIRVEPTGDPKLGWGRACGFGGSNLGSDTLDNAKKVIKILNDPDFAHCLGATSVGDNFRSSNYNNCYSLTNTVEEDLPSTITTIPNSFKTAMYKDCYSLLYPAQENLPYGVRTIGTTFRQRQYENCRHLLATANESTPGTITTVGANFRYYQYGGSNYELLVGSHIHSSQFPQWLDSISQAYSYMFYLPQSSYLIDRVPQYYADAEETVTRPITALEGKPTTRKYYVQNRLGIEGYNELNVNWK